MLPGTSTDAAWRTSLCTVSIQCSRRWARHQLLAHSAPVLQEMDPQWEYVQFNGTLGHQTKWTGDPSPEVDAVWEKWAHGMSQYSWARYLIPQLLVKYASIPETTFEELHGADLESARLTPEYGGWYIGFLEVSHHLHVSATEV